MSYSLKVLLFSIAALFVCAVGMNYVFNGTEIAVSELKVQTGYTVRRSRDMHGNLVYTKYPVNGGVGTQIDAEETTDKASAYRSVGLVLVSASALALVGAGLRWLFSGESDSSAKDEH